jgi:hypothetical protein
VAYVGDGMRWNNWTAATQQHYGLRSLSELQVTWLNWVRQGCPAFPPAGTLLAAQPAVPPPPAAEPVGAPAPYAAAVAAVPAPAVRLAAATADGWRVRQKHPGRSDTPAGGADSATADPQLSAAQPRERPGSEPLYRSLSRPQEPGQPQATALEWANPPSDPYRPILVPQRTAAPVDAFGTSYR